MGRSALCNASNRKAGACLGTGPGKTLGDATGGWAGEEGVAIASVGGEEVVGVKQGGLRFTDCYQVLNCALVGAGVDIEP